MRMRNAFSALCNLLIVVSVGAFLIRILCESTEYPGLYFRYFTTDSNIFAAVCALPALACNLRAAITGRGRAPHWCLLLHFTGAAALSVTFCTVLFFLGPTQGFDYMYSGDNLWLHLLNPLLAAAAFLAADRIALRWYYAFLGALPVIVYGGFYITNVLFTLEWPDFYGFMTFWYWQYSMLGMLLATLLLSFALWGLKQLITRVPDRPDTSTNKSHRPL